MNKTYKILFNLILLFNFFGTYIDSLGNNRYSNHDTVFVMSNQGFTDYVVIDCDTLSARDIFWKTVDWINKTYNNPNEVLLTQVEGDYLIFRGIAPNMVYLKPMGSKLFYSVRYRVIISFKDGRYKFDVDTLEMCNTNPNINPVWTELGISKGSIDYYYHTKNGEIQKIFQNYEIAIPEFFNNLNRNLKDYILSSDNLKQNDW
jgi:hypothetical protein